MRLGLTYTAKSDMAAEMDLRGLKSSDDALEEYDSEAMLGALVQAIESHGHTVSKLGWGASFLDRIRSHAPYPELVFNIAEGLGGRARESQIPAVLDMLGVPYVGSDPLALAVSLDKQATKDMVRAAGVTVPKGFLIRNGTNVIEHERRHRGLEFPLIVKPAYEGSSKGVHSNSVVEDDEQLVQRVNEIKEQYDQPALVEEYIWGVDVTVGIIGHPPAILGVMEIAPKEKPAFPWRVYSLEVKRNWRECVDLRCPPSLLPNAIQDVEFQALTAFHTLGCKDMARADFRVQTSGHAVFIEINPLPGLNRTDSDLVLIADAMGVPYEKMIGDIIDGAARRHKIG